MVFYIGSSSWNYSPEFSDLVYDTPVDSEYIPKFKHLLWDFSAKSIEFKGAIKAKIAHLLIQSHFHGKFTDIFHLLQDYFNQVKETIGINYTKVFFIYMATTQQHEDVKHFLNVMRKEEQQKGGELMIRILDELRLEGRLEGRQEGRLEGRQEGRLEGRLEGEIKGQIAIIENMLTAQLDWQSIQKLTGIDYQQFEDMKTKLQQFQINPVVADHAMSNSHKKKQFF